MRYGRPKALTVAQQYVNLRGNPLSAGDGILRAGTLRLDLRHFAFGSQPCLPDPHRDGPRPVAGRLRRGSGSRSARRRPQTSAHLPKPDAALPLLAGDARSGGPGCGWTRPSYPGRRCGCSTSRTGSHRNEWKGGGEHPGRRLADAARQTPLPDPGDVRCRRRWMGRGMNASRRHRRTRSCRSTAAASAAFSPPPSWRSWKNISTSPSGPTST